MAYVVVEFHEGDDDGGSVALVNNSWFTPRKREVFWPPYKEQSQFDRALKNGEAVTNDWTLHAVARIFFESDDLVKARLKLKQSQVHSNLESEEDDTNQKRKRIPRKLSESSDSEPKQDCLVRPPSIGKKNLKKRFELVEEKNSLRCDVPENFNEIRSTQHKNVGFSQISSTNSPSIASLNSTPRTLTKAPIHQFGFEGKIDALVSVVARVEEQNKQILALLERQDNVTSVKTHAQLPNLPLELPLKSVEEVSELDEYLQSNENAACSYLATLGGNTISTRCNRIFKHLLVDSTASLFNYYGKRSQKRAFSELTVKNLIVQAIKIAIPSSSNKEIEDSIKIWLKHAPERNKARSKV